MAGATSVLEKVSFCLLLIGMVIFVIGFSTPYWRHEEWDHKPEYDKKEWIAGYENNGLWRLCHHTIHTNSTPPWPTVEVKFCKNLVNGHQRDELRVTQFFETMGFLLVMPAALLLLLVTCVESQKDKKILPIASGVLCFAAGGCVIVGCIVFGTSEEYKHHLDWSLPLAIVGGVMFAFSGVVTLLMAYAVFGK